MWWKCQHTINYRVANTNKFQLNEHWSISKVNKVNQTKPNQIISKWMEWNVSILLSVSSLGLPLTFFFVYHQDMAAVSTNEIHRWKQNSVEFRLIMHKCEWARISSVKAKKDLLKMWWKWKECKQRVITKKKTHWKRKKIQCNGCRWPILKLQTKWLQTSSTFHDLNRHCLSNLAKPSKVCGRREAGTTKKDIQGKPRECFYVWKWNCGTKSSQNARLRNIPKN